MEVQQLPRRTFKGSHFHRETTIHQKRQKPLTLSTTLLYCVLQLTCYIQVKNLHSNIGLLIYMTGSMKSVLLCTKGSDNTLIMTPRGLKITLIIY